MWLVQFSKENLCYCRISRTCSPTTARLHPRSDTLQPFSSCEVLGSFASHLTDLWSSHDVLVLLAFLRKLSTLYASECSALFRPGPLMFNESLHNSNDLAVKSKSLSGPIKGKGGIRFLLGERAQGKGGGRHRPLLEARRAEPVELG